MPVLCSSLETAEKLVELGSEGLCLARAFWPGKLSIVAPAKLDFPNILLDKDNSLAVRVPNHECCLRLIEACGGSLVGTSANVSGEKPFLDSENTGLQDFASGADYLVKGVCGSDGLPSTVVKLSADGNLTIVREGAVPPRDIKKLSFK
jgi:L-threonylcarbamoyladenylate synthase